MTYASTHVIFIHECSPKLFYFRSEGVVGLVLAADKDVAVAEDLGTLYLVLLYILDALRERTQRIDPLVPNREVVLTTCNR